MDQGTSCFMAGVEYICAAPLEVVKVIDGLG
jgi:hypothetical protein